MTDQPIKISFGEAVNAAKDGRLVAREGWNGKGMFVFMRPADTLEVDFIIDKVKSLPESFKRWSAIHQAHETKAALEMGYIQGVSIEFLPYLCMKTADNKVVNGWLASQTDILALDWLILDY